MNHRQLLETFSNLKFIRKANDLLINTTENFGIRTLYGSAKSLFAATLLAKNPNAKFILIVPNIDTYHNYVDDLNSISGGNIYTLNAPTTKHSHIQWGHGTYIAELIDSLTR